MYHTLTSLTLHITSPVRLFCLFGPLRILSHIFGNSWEFPRIFLVIPEKFWEFPREFHGIPIQILGKKKVKKKVFGWRRPGFQISSRKPNILFFMALVHLEFWVVTKRIYAVFGCNKRKNREIRP